MYVTNVSTCFRFSSTSPRFAACCPDAYTGISQSRVQQVAWPLFADFWLSTSRMYSQGPAPRAARATSSTVNTSSGVSGTRFAGYITTGPPSLRFSVRSGSRYTARAGSDQHGYRNEPSTTVQRLRAGLSFSAPAPITEGLV